MYTGVAACLLATAAALAAAPAAATTADRPRGVTLAPAVVQTWRMGVIVHARGGLCTRLVATAPTPTDWPEQAVKVTGRQVSPLVSEVSFRELGDGTRQLVVHIPRLRPGESAQAILTCEIAKRDIQGPADTAVFRVPQRRTRELAAHLNPSPQIESRDQRIQSLADQITASSPNDWQKAEALFDWVRANIRYEFDPELKGALAALRDGQGDCEELTSLFVALCRAQGIPARSVWVPGHCYPEFYLEDDHGQGHWLPCQAAGADRQFGSMIESRPILQKGDSIRVPGVRQPQRYVQVTLVAEHCSAPPEIEWIHEAAPQQ